jgi:hypothetical protein
MVAVNTPSLPLFRFSLLATAALLLGCSNPAAPTETVSGTWLGEYRRVQCSFDDGTSCPGRLDGSEERGWVQLTLSAFGSGSREVAGTMDLGGEPSSLTVGFVPLRGSADGRSVTLTGTLTITRGLWRNERTFAWQLQLVGPGEMSGHWAETGVSFETDTRLHTWESRHDVVILRRQGGRRNPSGS